MAIFSLIKGAFQDWSKDKAARLAAALAYYTIFSIGPMLLVVIAIVGFIFGSDAAQGKITSTLTGVLGADGAKFLQGLIASANHPAAGIIATVVGLVTLLMSALGIFGQLKDALDTIWEVEPEKGGGIMGIIKKELLNFLILLGAGVLLVASLLANTLFAAISPLIGGLFQDLAILWNVLNYIVSFAILSFMFGALYKFLPDVRIAWKDALIGGAATALLFVVGQIALGIYLGFAKVGSAFGAAASLVVLLVWIYYSAIIVLLGAEFTQEYANNYGSGVQPKPGASFMTEEARAQQGTHQKGNNKSPRDSKQGAPAKSPALRASPWFR